MLVAKPDPDYHDLENLPYMEKFTKELFRFISPGKHPSRKVLELLASDQPNTG